MSTAGAARRVFVLGGGVAGLQAAFALADRGYRVELLESRRQLGGRAFASLDRASGERLDNGFHVMLGCYRGMRALLRRLGTEDGFQQDRSLAMTYRFLQGRSTTLSLSRLPVPLAMPWGLVRLGIGLGSRLRALMGMGCVLLGARERESLGEWLQRCRQTGEPDALFWRPLCRAVMNVEPEQASAADFLATLREAFVGRAASAAFWLPRRTWGELIGDPAPAALAAAGVQLRTGARVVGLPVRGGRIAAIELGSGDVLEVGNHDQVVSALPWFVLHKFVPQGVAHGFAALRSAPIVTAYFTLPAEAAAPPDEGPVVALVDGEPFHFLLRRPGEPVHRFALLSGGNRSFDGQTVAEITAVARAQLQRYYAAADVDAAVVRVRKEQHATFVAAPRSRSLRPRPGQLVGAADNLWVCGDWTDTGLPATLEGAVRSAELLLPALLRLAPVQLEG